MRSTRKWSRGRAHFTPAEGATRMNPSVLLMVSLLAWYAAAMVIFWCSLGGSTREERRETEGRFALKEGQTIVGVKDTGYGLAFALSDDVRDEEYYDL